MFKDIKYNDVPQKEGTSFGEKVKPSFFDKLNDKLDNLENEVSSVVQNKLDGCRRENEVAKELEKQYPEKEGYKVLRERELCDKDGNPVID